MLMPTQDTRRHINRRIVQAGIRSWADAGDKTANAEKAICVVKEVLFQHSSIEAAFLALTDPRIEDALQELAEFTLTDKRFEFLKDSIASRSYPERLQLVSLLLSYAEEKSMDKQLFSFVVALTLLEETIHFEEKMPLYWFKKAVELAITNRMCRQGEYLEVPELQKMLEAIEKEATRSL